MTKFVTLSIERLNQVIEALNNYCNTGEIDCADDLVAELLAERDQKQGEQEPVARVVGTGHMGGHFGWCKPDSQDYLPPGALLYTHPHPRREPLTDEQIDDIIRALDPLWLDTPTGFEEDFCRAIERTHGIGGEV